MHVFSRARVAAALLPCALIVAGLFGCGGQARNAGDSGPLSRVVCVSKQINEFLFEIGAQGHLVGRDLTSTYPPEIQKLTSVGYHRALSAEGIVSLKPTLFLTDGNVGPGAVLDQLRKVGIPIEVMRPGNTTDSAQLLMQRLGERFQCQRAADSVVAAWKQGMAAVLADTGKWTGQKKPKVLIMHFGQIVNNYLGLKSGGPAGQMVRWAGGVNAIDSAGGMSRLTPELIARLAPDVIVATEVGFDRLGSVRKFQELPGVNLTPAGKSGCIYRIEENEIMYFTPRTPASVKKLAALLHP